MIFSFQLLMVLTFLAAVATLAFGIGGLGKRTKTADAKSGTRIMALRVGLCILLLIEIIIYQLYLQ